MTKGDDDDDEDESAKVQAALANAATVKKQKEMVAREAGEMVAKEAEETVTREAEEMAEQEESKTEDNGSECRDQGGQGKKCPAKEVALPPPPKCDNEDEEEDECEDDEMPPLVDTDFDEDEDEGMGQFTCEADPTGTAFVTITFEGHTPSMTLTFMDSGASDYFFHNHEDFTEYTLVAFHTGSSAMERKGTFEILGQGTAMKMFRLDGKNIKLTFKNVLHSLSLAANVISVSALDKAGLSTVFSNSQAAVHDRSGKEVFAG
ncbi:hypothetical protein ARMGADRAFT_1088744 [Armillaria gallica]|uniref:Retrovirus-related Pol polyprotein from transposon TNT 1-94-like beta-barrel domain-containing protein n=1 Tax=Armillaria gallica TaxID=47427 RepID=A0A2H3D6U4_ARMGA|nr:hypothetical protein ARMGADRAFT_1088744 [Armillaria gallica]